MRRAPLLPALLALAVASGFAEPSLGVVTSRLGPQGPPAQSAQGQTQGGRGQGRAGAQGGPPQGAGQPPPPRDQQQTPAGAATASISGRVLTADTGRPVKRAQVMISGTGRGGRGVITDDRGAYSVTGLAAGNHTFRASKNCFVAALTGPRRSTQPGSPTDPVDNQQAT